MNRFRTEAAFSFRATLRRFCGPGGWTVALCGKSSYPMSVLALIDAVIQDWTSFKKAGPQLELLPPDQQAVDRLVAAYCAARIPGWLAVYLLGCVGHAAGYETGKSILFSNEGKSFAGVALVKMDKARAFDDLRQVILSGQHPKVRRDAAYGLALYRSEDAINVFLTAHEEGRLPLNQISYNVAQCAPTDTTLVGLLRNQNDRKQKLALAIIEWLVAENTQMSPPGNEVAGFVDRLLRVRDVTISSHRREKLAAWLRSVRGAAT